MGSRESQPWLVAVFLLAAFVPALGQNLSNLTQESLDSALRDHALQALRMGHSRTGILYSARTNLSGIEVNVTRLKSGSFWGRGVNYSYVSIPTRVLPMPYVKRLAIVYQNLANWSDHFYHVPGHTMVAPVVGFLAYNATSLTDDGGNSSFRKLDLRVMGDPISVYFPSLGSTVTKNSSTKCVRFGQGGSVHFSELVLPNVCLARTQGHFSVVIPSVAPQAPGASPAASEGRWGRGRWKLWAIAGGCGVAGLALLGLVALAAFNARNERKMVKMQREADDGEALGSVWIGESRLPSATAIRTQPVLENELAP